MESTRFINTTIKLMTVEIFNYTHANYSTNRVKTTPISQSIAALPVVFLNVPTGQLTGVVVPFGQNLPASQSPFLV